MIKRAFALLAFMLFAALPAFAQHSAVLTWTNSTDTPNTNVYRLAGVCPATIPSPTNFTRLNTTGPVTTATFTDTAPLLGQACYYVTATLNGAESVPSTRAQSNISLAAPSTLIVVAK